MSEERARVLNMLAEGKISAGEAERLLDALDSRSAPETPPQPAGPAFQSDSTPLVSALPKYLRVRVDSAGGDKVDVKVPLALVRSGLKLTSLIPPLALDKINEQLSANGISLDFSNLRPEDIDELIQALHELEVTVDSQDGDKVRVYCE